MNCVIIDDEPMARKLLQEYIAETDFLVLSGVAENPLRAMVLLNETPVDLLFLDINMPKMNGMEFLRSSISLPMVILTTAYDQYALEGFEMAVIDYLVKPFSLERFIKASQKAMEQKILKTRKAAEENGGPDFFYVKCNGKIERVLYDELLYAEANANYVTLHTVQGKLIVYLTIKGLLEKLPGEKFIQVHKSTLVNTGKVKTIEGNLLHIGGDRISVGLSFQEAVMNKLLTGRFLKR